MSGILSKSKLKRFVDRIGIGTIGLYCVLSIIFGADFAEMHVQFAFLSFPIFVGEFLMLFLFAWLGFKIYLTQEWPPYLIFWGAYYIWILVYAYIGYTEWGALTFRNAALFYYVTFALFGYMFFQINLFYKKKYIIPVLVILVMITMTKCYNNYYWYSVLMINLFLIFKALQQYPWLVIPLFILSHINNMFIPVRAHLIGLIMSLSYIFFVGTICFVRLPIWKKLGAMFLLLVLMAGALILFSDNNTIKSIVNFNGVRASYAKYDGYIQANLGKYQTGERPYKLYRPNENVINLSSIMPGMDKDQNDEGYEEEDIGEDDEQGEQLAMEDTQVIDQERPALDQVVHEPPKVSNQETSMTKNQEPPIIEKKGSSKAQKQRLSLVRKQSPQVVQKHDLHLPLSETKSHTPSDSIRASSLRPTESSIKKTVPDESLPVHPAVSLTQELKHDGQAVEKKSKKHKTKLKTQEVEIERNPDVLNNNILFRIFIWRDMLERLGQRGWFRGVGFGEPQRSKSLEILGWGEIAWEIDGWVMPHNGFLHMIYRGGIVGILLVVGLLAGLTWLTVIFVKLRDMGGIALISTLIYWIGFSAFSVTLEFPHYAIFFWSLFGVAFAYARDLKIRRAKEQ